MQHKQHTTVVQDSIMIELAKIIAEQSIKIGQLEYMNNLLQNKLTKLTAEAEDDNQND